MSTSQRTWNKYLVFDGTTTWVSNTSSKAYYCDDFKSMTLEITAQANSTLTVKVVGSDLWREDSTSLSDVYPVFTSADSVTNPWSYISMVNLDTRVAIPGSTGTTYTAQSGTRKFNVETNQLTWFGIEISGYSAGGVRVKIAFTDNR